MLDFRSFPHDGGPSSLFSFEHTLWKRLKDRKAKASKHERVAYFYTVARLLGEHPTKTVAEAFGITSDAAAQRVDAVAVRPVCSCLLASEQKAGA